MRQVRIVDCAVVTIPESPPAPPLEPVAVIERTALADLIREACHPWAYEVFTVPFRAQCEQV